MISKRARSIDASGIRKVFDLGAKLKDPINLSIGQPDFDTWPEIKDAAKQAIDAGRNGYTVTQGIEPLREKLRQRYGLTAGGPVDVMVTSGVSGGLALSFMALLDPGDELLIPDPYFVLYRDLAMLINAVPTYYSTYPTFALDAAEIEKQITPRTKALLVCSPSNPTGYSATQAELDSVIDVARRHDLWLIYDEIYEAFNYDHDQASAFGKYEKTILLNGFSKSYGIPGWRIGYAVAPMVVLQEMLKIQQYSFVCAPAPVQWAMVEGLEVDLSAKIAEYGEKRDFIFNALKDKFDLQRPGGAFYLFPRAPQDQATKFVERCIENNLLVIPGSVFSQRDSHFRVSFAAPMATLERGVEVLRRLAG